MKPGKFSRLSIVLAAVTGTALIVLGLLLLLRDPPPKSDESKRSSGVLTTLASSLGGDEWAQRGMS